MAPPSGALWTAAVLLLSSAALAAPQQQPLAACPVDYAPAPDAGARSLLLGGVHARCVGAACQPRNTTFAKACSARSRDMAIWGVCEDWQQALNQRAASSLAPHGLRQFNPCKLWRQLAPARTLWLIGDSHTKNLWYSMRCVMLDYYQHAQGECAASAVPRLQQQLEETTLQGHHYNTPPRCLHLLGGARVCLVHSPLANFYVTGDKAKPGTLELLHASFAAPGDLFYIAFGRWHEDNASGISASFGQALEAVGRYLQATRSRFPHVWYSPPPHDHMRVTAGALDQSGWSCPSPAKGGYNVSQGAEVVRVARSILTGKYGVPVMGELYEATRDLLTDSHIGPEQSIDGAIDCLHYCRPGQPEMELWNLARHLQAAGFGQGQDASGGEQLLQQADGLATRPCVTLPSYLPLPKGRLPGRPGVKGPGLAGPDAVPVRVGPVQLDAAPPGVVVRDERPTAAAKPEL